MPQYHRDSYVEDLRSFEDITRPLKTVAQICSLLCAGVIAMIGEEKSRSCTILTALLPSPDTRAFAVSFRYHRNLEGASQRYEFVLHKVTLSKFTGYQHYREHCHG